MLAQLGKLLRHLFSCCPDPDIHCRDSDGVGRKYCMQCGYYQKSPLVPTLSERWHKLRNGQQGGDVI